MTSDATTGTDVTALIDPRTGEPRGTAVCSRLPYRICFDGWRRVTRSGCTTFTTRSCGSQDVTRSCLNG